MSELIPPAEHALRPCPFCGNPAKLFEGKWGGPTKGLYFGIECLNEECGAQNRSFEERDACIAAWNNRYVPKDLLVALATMAKGGKCPN